MADNPLSASDLVGPERAERPRCRLDRGLPRPWGKGDTPLRTHEVIASSKDSSRWLGDNPRLCMRRWWVNHRPREGIARKGDEKDHNDSPLSRAWNVRPPGGA